MNDTNDASSPASDLDARIAALSPEKRALLAQRLVAARSAAGEENIPPVTPLARASLLPVSFAQQRLWFLEQWEGGSALYNIARGWWLRGPVDVARLRAAVAQLIARHDALRTALVSEAGQPRQQVLAELAVELPLVDLSTLPAERAHTQAQAQALTLARQGFDLTQPPL